MAAHAQLDMKVLRELVEGSGMLQKQNSVSWIFPCPKCNKSQKLYIRKKDGRFVCWSCKGDGYEGRPEFALTDLLGLSLRDLRKKLYGIGDVAHVAHFEIVLDDHWGLEADDEEEVIVLPKTSYWPLDYYEIDHKFAERGREYLATRGVSLEIARKYGLRYCPPERRVIFPVQHAGALVGWQKRAVFETKIYNEEDNEIIEIPKILSSKGLSGIRENCVMFSESLRGSEHAIICEGPVDALKTDLCGGGIATMGKSMSDGQIELIKDSGVKRVYLALDPDAAGEMQRLTRAFIDFDVRQILPGPGFKDLGEMTPEGVRELFDVAPRVGAGRVFVHLQDWSKLKPAFVPRGRRR